MASNRRRFIKGVGAAATVGLAGCGGGGDGGGGDGGGDGSGGDGGGDGSGGDGGGDGGSTGSGGPQRVEFHFVASTPAESTQEALTNAVNAWGEQLDGYEIEPTMEFVGVVDSSPTLNQYLGTGNPPTLVMGNAPLAQFHANLEDASDFLSQFDYPDPAYGGPVGDKQVIIPDHFVVQTRFYRKDLYDQAGITPAATWEEHSANVRALDETIPDDMFPELIMANPSITTTYLQDHPTQHTLGVDFIERTGDALSDVRVSLGDDQERQTAIDILEHYSDIYQFSPESINYGFFDMISVYLEGQVAATNYPGRLIDNAVDQAPDMIEKTGVARFPMPAGTDDYLVGHNPQTLVVPQTENSDLAFDFLDFYFGSDHYFERLLGAGPNSTPITQELLNDERLTSHETWDNPLGQEYRDELNSFWDNDNYYMAQYGRTDPASIYWPALLNDTGISMEMSANGYTGRTTPEEAVDQTIERLEAELPGVLEGYT